MPEFETVIGLEVHLQLKTATKIFCGCANRFGEEPNTRVCPVCLGLPGSLPVLNQKALLYAVKIALALNCEVVPLIKFDRKNYYYPDLPKGYQISQYDLPVGRNGYLEMVTQKEKKKILIKRVHLEEDAGKLIHDPQGGVSLVDYNRTGTPLMEIVSEPDLRSSQEAYDYLTALKLTLQYLEVSDCDMEKGSLRADANISIRSKGDEALGIKAEVKNMNSFRAVKAALEFEEKRQKALHRSNQRIIQETRLWDDAQGITQPMRSKEEVHDYRYFPEPDLVPFIVSDQTIAQVKNSLPELPQQKGERLIRQYQISEYEAQILIQDKDLSDFLEKCLSLYHETKKIANWIIGPVLQELNDRKISFKDLGLKAENFIGLIKRVDDGTLSRLVAKDVFKEIMATGKAVDDLVTQKNLTQISDEAALELVLEEVLRTHAQVIEQIRQGKESAIGFLIGQAMRKTQGKANPKKIGELIKRRFVQ